MPNMFEKAKTIKTAKPAAKKDKRLEVELPGLKQYATVCMVLKSLEAIKKTMEPAVKDQMADIFVATGIEVKKRPDNFRGTDQDASASCEMRKRSSASALRDDEINLLEEHQIPMEREVITEETFVINPAYAGDSKMLEQVSKALSKVKGMPDDFILRQDGVSRVVVPDNALDVMFTRGINDADTLRNILSVVATLAIKPKIEGNDADALSSAYNELRDLLGLSE